MVGLRIRRGKICLKMEKFAKKAYGIKEYRGNSIE